ncbi:MAG: hypothetical protein GY754_33305 [bacterium]|nr:hypothetical protein [bacterium]
MNLKSIQNLPKNLLKSLLVLALFALIPGCEEGLYQSSPGAVDGGVSINNNEGTTYSRTITLQLNINDAHEMRFSLDANHWSEWENYSSIKEYTLDESFGEQFIYAEFRRRHSLRITEITASITLIKMNGSGFTINSGSDFTDSSTVSLSLTVSGAVQMRFSNDNSTWSAWEAYSSIKSWDLEAGLGFHTVYAEFLDSAGNNTAMDDSISVVDMADAGSSSFVINNDLPTSFLQTVSFDMNVNGAVEMRFSYDGLFWTDWESYNSQKTWTFANGIGAKTVIGQFRDATGTVVQKSDNISITDSSGFSITINNGEGYVLGPNSQLSLNASGVSEVCFSNDNSTWSPWVSYSSSKSWQLDASSAGSKTVYVKFRDASGNELVKSDTISVTTSGSMTFPKVGYFPGSSGGSYIGGLPAANTYLASVPGAKLVRIKINTGNWTEWAVFDPNPQAGTFWDGGNFACMVNIAYYYEFKDSYGNVVSHYEANGT